MTPPTQTTPEVRLSSVGQIFIRVHDLERAVGFYRDSLGLRFLFQAPPGMAFFQCGDLRIMLGVPEKPEFDHPSSIVYFRVEDVEAAHRSLLGRGVVFVAAPHIVHRAPGLELWMAFFRDADDNMLALMCEKKTG